MILKTMLDRLHASLTSGPSLNARPHSSRQRMDVMELQHLKSVDPAKLIATLLSGNGTAEVAAKVPVFVKPELPEEQWSDEQRKAKALHDRQARVLSKLRDIAEDANDYYNDHGEQALFIGFPLVSIPSRSDRGAATKRILAPALLIPINMRVRRGAGAGVTIELVGDGADLIQPNPGLLAWIEQQTGKNTDDLFADDAGEEPWKEIAEVLLRIEQAAGIDKPVTFNADSLLNAAPRTDDLPNEPVVLPCAVLGLFPLTNPGLLRDTKWMMEKEVELIGPVRAFLNPDALAEPEDSVLPEAIEHDYTMIAGSSSVKNFSDELLVTHADPCQAEAVHHARISQALVVHGPPGTGKSQTIANIIGDHLAREQRVLFVCDKRTALDVVKYRLDSMGLGELCGVVHDPQRDRKDLYLKMRERLELLAEEKPLPDPASSLALINDRLDLLHRELRGYFDRLHTEANDRPSFHRLCGEWLELQLADVVQLPVVAGLTAEMIERNRTDIEEITKRAIKARWPENPLRDGVRMTLASYQTTDIRRLSADLSDAQKAVVAIDTEHGKDELPLPEAEPLDLIAASRKALAEAMTQAALQAPLELVGAIWRLDDRAILIKEVDALRKDLEPLERPLDREIQLQLSGRTIELTECNQRLLRIKEWEAISTSWRRWFAGKLKGAAKEALAPLGLGLLGDDIQRAKNYLEGTRVRHIWSDLYGRTAGPSMATTPDDQTLIRFAKGTPALCALLDQLQLPIHESIRELAMASLQTPEGLLRCADRLHSSVRLSTGLNELQRRLTSLGLFTNEVVSIRMQEMRKGHSIASWLERVIEFLPTLEDVMRMTDRAATLSAPLQEAMETVVAQGLPFEVAEPALRSVALQLVINDKLRTDPELSRIDTERIEAGFSELLSRTQEKTERVRDRIKHIWQKRWRRRLLASTGGRLNSLGATLRQRLFVRGQKAMKLRQMIASGAGTAEGDPLFDLCPVWMASPSTVAQIFPREPLFDVIVFDEASQCRLEEALPVLLRGKRVVIAGDPKQLPPTRFFEGALTESDDGDAETAEELFASRQSQAEDLLSSALNLNVQEAFLDVHYRSRNEGLIGFSNDAFYGSRLQPIPGHPKNKLMRTPIELIRVDGTYIDRTNPKEAAAVVDLVSELLNQADPPSIGVACFNITQRDAILDALDKRASESTDFAMRLQNARQRKGRDSFEGLFVKNLENVQGDERDHMIICTTFGPDKEGKFRRNFGALSRSGGERRLNVLVTRARDKVHVLTSIPRSEYVSTTPLAEGQSMTGRHHLYGYLRYAEYLAEIFKKWQDDVNALHEQIMSDSEVRETKSPSQVAESLGRWFSEKQGIGNRVYWGNDGFCVDVALTHPGHPADVTIGVLTDFTRYRKTPDPIAWELFRSTVLLSQGWDLHRLWTPAIFKDHGKHLADIRGKHHAISMAAHVN
ncbi:MAG: AAA domain-containing protein [Flavobacteriales bacterium]